MHISEFDYDLPDELIAQEPLEQRDASRMLVVDRRRQECVDSLFAKLPEYVREHDVLVINNTRVFPARLRGRRIPSGGSVEVLLLRELKPLSWEALVRPGHRLRQGAQLEFGEGRLRAEVLNGSESHLRQLRFDCNEPWESVLAEIGETPLPPYIKRSQGDSSLDRARYQTLFARKKGAVAAPTAGLHFTPSVLKQLSERGAQLAEITLHVGYGTFEPVRVEEIAQHRVASEHFEIHEESVQLINHARAQGGRVIAIGTTTTRALESATNATGTLEATRTSAELTITPGYKFRITDALLTNFHLPKSSLLLLACAFGGRELVLQSYRHAVEARYRFYSYGDCMLVI